MIATFPATNKRNKEKSEQLVQLIDGLIAHIEVDQDRLLEAHGTFRVEHLITVLDEMRLREIVFNKLLK